MEKLISKLIENEIIYVVKASKIKQILDFSSNSNILSISIKAKLSKKAN